MSQYRETYNINTACLLVRLSHVLWSQIHAQVLRQALNIDVLTLALELPQARLRFHTCFQLFNG
jgi:hypothetical protein